MKTLILNAAASLALLVCISGCDDTTEPVFPYDDSGCVGCVIGGCTTCPPHAYYDLPVFTVYWSEVLVSDTSITIPFFIKYDSVLTINQIGADVSLGQVNIFLDTAKQTVLFLSEPDTIDFTQLADYGTWGTADHGGPAWYYHYTMVIDGLEKGTTYTIAPFIELTINGRKGHLFNGDSFDEWLPDMSDDYGTYQTKYY
ncbi:MAG: hypothetical protein OEV74_06950 [Cyclobacteriaceae bacterium]|nr:hypothetical protein [Cyclobacteriaceae bacterium]MDH4295998.1 hypothetical protein [Cyclobacteriaceae bacterium]MDH5248475.1 hypothetical protein [Cyclobacteriaceae bacterium]